MEYCSMAKFHIKANVPIPREIRAVPLGYRNIWSTSFGCTLNFNFPSFLLWNNTTWCIYDDHTKNVTFSGHIPFSNWLSSKGLLFPLRKLWWEVEKCITTYWYEKGLLSSFFASHHFFRFSFQLVSSKQSRPDTYCISKVRYEKKVPKEKAIFYFFNFVERLFGKAWREEFVVLYEDSSLIWFRDRDRNEPEGGILLKDAPEMLAAGQVNRNYYSLSTTLNALAF